MNPKYETPQKTQIVLDDDERNELSIAWEELRPRLKNFSDFAREMLFLGIDEMRKAIELQNQVLDRMSKEDWAAIGIDPSKPRRIPTPPGGLRVAEPAAPYRSGHEEPALPRQKKRIKNKDDPADKAAGKA